MHAWCGWRDCRIKRGRSFAFVVSIERYLNGRRTMAIDFTFSPAVENARLIVRKFMHDVVKEGVEQLQAKQATPEQWRAVIESMRAHALVLFHDRARSRGIGSDVDSEHRR